MTTRHSAILIGTHLLALGAGWWAVRESAVTADPAPALPGKTERSPRNERRVDTADLLAAYGNSEFWSESQQLRKPVPREAPDTGSSSVYVPAVQRAAETADIPGALQEQLEAVNGHKGYDHELAKALIRRWMKEDAASCAAWLGRMNSRVGWGDPFNAFAEALPPQELIGLMEGWLQNNRERALSAMAEQVGQENASELPAILSRLGADEAKRFLGQAESHARVEDAALWRSLLDAEPKRFALLGNKWIQGPGADWGWSDGEWQPQGVGMNDWETRAEMALAAVAGTPAEQDFRDRLEAERHRSEVGRELARLAREPAAATEALVALHRAEGHDEAEALRLTGEAISRSYQGGLQDWRREPWEQDLQLSMLGRQSVEVALATRLDAIDSSLPEVLRPGTRGSSWRDAMAVDPAATFEVARQRGLSGEAARAAADLVGATATSLPVRAEILGLLADQGLWKQGGRLPDPETFATDYLSYDPVAARAWLERLPESLSKPLEEGSR